MRTQGMQHVAGSFFGAPCDVEDRCRSVLPCRNEAATTTEDGAATLGVADAR